MQHKNGFTLIELLVTILVLSILVTIGISSYQRFFAQQALTQKAEHLYHFLRHANTQAIKTNKRIYVHFCQNSSSGNWAMGMTDQAECDCFSVNSCVLNGREIVKELVDGKQLFINKSDISFSGLQASYAPMRFSVNPGAVQFSDVSGNKLKVIQSRMRLRICSPGVASMGYREC